MLGAGSASVLAGCSSSASSSSSTTSSGASSGGGKPGINNGPAKKGGSVTIATLAEIDGFFPPSNHWDTNGFLYANTVYDPLMWIAADGTVQPYLAKSLTPNSDFTVWTMTLRPGVKFSDGSDLTSTVVKNNYTALAASALTGTALKGITSVDTPDSMTLVYNLAAPRPAFAAGLASQVGYVVGQAMLDQTAARQDAHAHRDRTLHLRLVAAQRPLHRHQEPQLLAERPPPPRPGHLQAHSRRHPASRHPEDRWRRPDLDQ